MPRDGDKIGAAAKPIRQKRAICCAKPKYDPPVSANIPPAGNGKAEGEGHLVYETQPAADLAEIVERLVAIQKIRRFCIKAQSQANTSIEALIASAVGYRIDQGEKDRKAAFAQAKAFRLSVEKTGENQTHESNSIAHLVPLILASATGRQTWDVIRSRAENDMKKACRSLPDYEFAKSVRGLGDLGHAAIWANAGIPISEYRTVSGLWKRMGLATINGERQRKKSNPEEARAHGYSPSRRSDVWCFCSDSLFRAQWRAANIETGEAAHAIGPYGEVYARRRAHTAPRINATADLPLGHPEKWTLGRCHNDARRIMTKALLRDMWVAAKNRA